MYLAEYQSSNFVFEGVGRTEKEARSVLQKVIKLYCKRTKAIAADFFYPDEIYVREIQEGFGFIDKEKCEF